LDVAPRREKPSRSQRYRYALLAGLIAVGAALGVLVSASIVIDLFATGRKEARREALAAPELAACHADVRLLLERLAREAARLELLPLEGRPGDLVTTWDGFAGSWDTAWREIDTRCRFSQLADRGLGTAYDRMAWVHRSLPSTKKKYAEKMARFSRDLAGEVAQMRRALDKSLADLEAQERR
jgi:hypothetical protein